MFIEAKDDVSGGDNRSCRACKAPVKSSPPTNQHLTFYRPDALPVALAKLSKHWMETVNIWILLWLLLLRYWCRSGSRYVIVTAALHALIAQSASEAK